jgi:hypothetical protein
MVVWVLLNISAALTRAMSTFSLALKSLTNLFGGLGLMISQKADTARNQAFEGRPFIRLAYSISVGKGKNQEAKTKNWQKLKTLTMKKLTKNQISAMQ